MDGQTKLQASEVALELIIMSETGITYRFTWDATAYFATHLP